MLNNLGDLRNNLMEKSTYNSTNNFQQLSNYHDSLVKAMPRSLRKELKYKGN
jgi:hypothetical protein